MELVCHKNIEHKTFVHHFDDEQKFVYVLKLQNNRLVDDFFADKHDLYLDGSPKADERVYFYSPFDIANAKREVGNFNLSKLKNFSWFKNQLYFFNEKGEISHLKAEK